MKRILLSLSIFFLFAKSFAQPITVNTTTYTVPQLVQDVLFGNGTAGSACVGTISNITWSTGTNFGSSNGIGYFTNTNPNFPLANGVILTNGLVNSTPGPNNELLGDGNFTWLGDNDLRNYLLNLGLAEPADEFFNATILEFDFTPLTNQMSFDFLFASEEYGTFQCLGFGENYSDAFAFFLTNETAGTPPINVALVPNATSETPISVYTIRDDANNADCASANEEYFGRYNVGANSGSSAIDFNGQTTSITASAAVIPGNTYHIKLVIADRNDQSYDSAVFLGGGSFNIGSADLAGTGVYDGLTDLTIANGSGICNDVAITIQAGAVALPGVTYQWTLDTNIIPGANTNSYTITQGGDYGITITYPGGCQQSDTMTVEYFPPLTLGTPSNITQCSQPFDVTVNESTILNGNVGTVSYHYTLSGAKAYADYIANPNSYDGSNGQEIFVAVEDATNGCISTTSFFVIEDTTLCTPPVTPGTPPDLTEFELTLGGGIGDFDFTPQLPFVYGSYNLTDYTVTFYTSPADANSGVNPINPINTFLGTDGQIIYVRLQDNLNPGSFGVTSFTLFVNPLPNAAISQSTSICSGQNATVTFQGTPNATVTYNINGGSNLTTILNSSGDSIILSAVLTSTTVYNLVSVQDPNDPTVIVPLIGSITITVNTAPVITTPTVFVVCDDSLDNDGFNCFDLTQKDSEVSTDP
ncbi:MAG: choice-of-anchor L domain-containing protein, partial [Flavobacterium sp.]|uniref:choice-of-anchor L domain-containing protein n=1 Tax=Flavobacterium sp. TaxID=239 RepID=UPI0022C4789B